MDQEALDRLTELLTKDACSAVWIRSGILHVFFPNCGLFVSSFWQINTSSRTLIAQDDGKDDDIEDIAGSALTGHKIRNLEVKGVYHNLTLTFDDSIELATSDVSEQYEHWYVASAPEMIIAGPGSCWSRF